MVRDALSAARTREEENVFYYGFITDASTPVTVYTSSSWVKTGKADARAGSGVYWGENNRNTASAPQSDARTALYAVTLAIMGAPRGRTLTIYSVSQCTIRSFCYWAGGNANLGWPVLALQARRYYSRWRRIFASCLRARTAAVPFCWVDPV
ncbi:hypothetical protein DFH09DRAFT_914833 [Mycena vulgaris]|nr:hypothetical protein DFH09DRAFT_914833 [Mycena vulgaris]